jgi:hypothetical protein
MPRAGGHHCTGSLTIEPIFNVTMMAIVEAIQAISCQISAYPLAVRLDGMGLVVMFGQGGTPRIGGNNRNDQTHRAIRSK